jgi:hypothetical protein
MAAMLSMTTVEKIRPPLKKLVVSCRTTHLSLAHALPMNKIPVPMNPFSNYPSANVEET